MGFFDDIFLLQDEVVMWEKFSNDQKYHKNHVNTLQWYGVESGSCEKCNLLRISLFILVEFQNKLFQEKKKKGIVLWKWWKKTWL